MIICSPQLGLNPRSVLGGEVFDREILLGLAKHGIKIRIILPKNSPHDGNIKNWQITEIPFAHFPAVLFNLILIPYLFLLNKEEKIDVVRLHQPQFTCIAALIFKVLNPSVKILATYHKFEETHFGPFSKFFNNRWSHIICDSDAVKSEIINKYSVSRNKITVVHNGVPSYLKPQLKDKKLVNKHSLSGKIILLFMGLFVKRKNPLFLLDVLSTLVKKNSNVVLIFWGKGPLKKAITEKAKRLNLYNNILFINPIFGPNKNKIHNLADIFLHPSLDEGFALAPLESMACAKPIVITDAYSANEAVESNGFKCAANDIKDWVDSVNKLIKNYSLRKRMGDASLAKVHKEFSWRLSINKHIQILNEFSRNE
ncbi:MAG: glycosyl transferase, group 1 [uncultured bacterium]|nr:MAG: glycosyl transferase, group 1 [uncultured bacterium]